MHTNITTKANATVKAWTHATVKAWTHATVKAWTHATVKAWTHATVKAWTHATVKLNTCHCEGLNTCHGFSRMLALHLASHLHCRAGHATWVAGYMWECTSNAYNCYESTGLRTLVRAMQQAAPPRHATPTCLTTCINSMCLFSTSWVTVIAASSLSASKQAATSYNKHTRKEIKNVFCKKKTNKQEKPCTTTNDQTPEYLQCAMSIPGSPSSPMT